MFGSWGILLVVLGLLPVLTQHTWNRPHRLIVNPTGVRRDDPYGTSWTVSWQELDQAAIVITGKFVYDPISQSWQRTMVSLELTPRDPGFPDRHPELTRHGEARSPYRSYRLSLGDDDERHVVEADKALRLYAPDIYCGINHEIPPGRQ